MMEWIKALHFDGIIIGICTFLIIGMFHPIVIKAEYYWGTRCWWIGTLVDILASGHSGNRPVAAHERHSDLLSAWSIFLLFVLEHQRDIRTARTGT